MQQIENQAYSAAKEIIEKAGLTGGDILVVGCSTSEVIGNTIGTNSSPDVAEHIYIGIASAAKEAGVFVAAQCCEHLNRAIIISAKAVDKKQIVNVVPQPKAGGSFATAAYKHIENAIAVESIEADAGLDIGFTMIGMHIRQVAVPVRLKNNAVGKATVLAARHRPKFIGGVRAIYNDNLL